MQNSLKEKFMKDSNSIIWCNNLMADSSVIGVDLMIIAAWLALISKEVNLIEIFLHELKTETLVPALWEHIKWNLPTNRECQIIGTHFSSKCLYKSLSNVGSLIILLELITLLSGTVSTDGANIDHTWSVFNECASINR